MIIKFAEEFAFIEAFREHPAAMEATSSFSSLGRSSDASILSSFMLAKVSFCLGIDKQREPRSEILF